MSTERQATCAERLPAQLAGRLQDLELLAAAASVNDADSLRELLEPDGFDAPAILTRRAQLEGLGIDTAELAATLPEELADRDAEELAESAREALDSYGLSVDVRTTLVWQLSTGGPGDQFELEVSRESPLEYSLDAARYRFLDWFDGAAAELESEQVAIVERAAELLGLLEPGIVLPAGE